MEKLYTHINGTIRRTVNWSGIRCHSTEPAICWSCTLDLRHDSQRSPSNYVTPYTLRGDVLCGDVLRFW